MIFFNVLFFSSSSSSPEGDQNGRPLPRAAKATPMARPDETLADGRLASTPEGACRVSMCLVHAARVL